MSEAPESAADWSEHTTPEGKKYYFNAKTQVSTWEKPDILLSKEEEESCPWSEHTADNGKKYYYNHVTKKSTWEMPPDFKPIATVVPATKPEKEPSVTEKEKKVKPKNLTPRELAIATFKELLAEAEVDYTWTWDNTMRAIIHDDRYRVLNSLTERKQVWAEYVEEMKRKEKDNKKAKEEAEKSAFVKMLVESGQVTPRTSYRKAAQLFEKDPRWQAISRERDREDLYDDFLWEIEQKELEEERERHKTNLAAYQQLIAEHPRITVKTQWRKLKEELKDDPRFRAVDRLTRLTVFEARIKELERKELEQKRIERENKHRQERKNRDAFRAMLQEKYKNGDFHVRTKWKEFRNQIKDSELYNNMLGQSGYLHSTPHELYGDFVEDLEERYARDEAVLQAIVREQGVVVTAQSAVEHFVALVASSVESSTLDPANVRVFFEDLKQTAVKEEEREKAKLAKNFRLMLKGFKDAITENTLWGDEIRNVMLQEPSYIALNDDNERERVFNEYISELKRNNKKAKRDEDSSSEEEGRIRSSSEEVDKVEKTDKKSRRDKKRRKHRHHRHDDRDGHEKRHKKHRKDYDANDESRDKRHKRRYSDHDEEQAKEREKKRRKESLEQGEKEKEVATEQDNHEVNYSQAQEKPDMVSNS